MSMKRRKRRLWDDVEKHRIVAQMRVAGVSISQVRSDALKSLINDIRSVAWGARGSI